MPHAEICPVCYGKGVVCGVAETGAFPTTKCHGCGGTGWVVVPNDTSTYWPPVTIEDNVK